jgi:hypothetical protein
VNKLERVYNRAANKFGIYPHDGKKVIFIEDGKLHQGLIMGSTALTGHTTLSEVGSVELMEIRNEAAAALKSRKTAVSRKLHRGEMVIYPPSEES